MQFLNTFFGWPNGSVWGNFVASLLWSVPLWTVGYVKLKRQRERHHKQLKEHIDYKFSKLTDKSTN